MKLNFFDYVFIAAFLCSILVTGNTLYHISNPYIYEMNPIIAMILEYGVFGMVVAFILACIIIFIIYYSLRTAKDLSPIFAKGLSLISFSLIVFVLINGIGVVLSI